MSDIVLGITIVFMVLGAIDKIIGNKYGLGEQFDEGFMVMGSLAIAMVGIVSFAPVMAKILQPAIVPIYQIFGADPAMFATTLLANDMGGYSLAKQLAVDPAAGLFAGIILGSMMGPTIVFTIPVALGIIEKKDHKYLASGAMIGMVTIPLGCLAGGLTAHYDIVMILNNLMPITLAAIVIALGLWLSPPRMIAGFAIFGKGLTILITIATVCIVIQTLTGFTIIPGMTPIDEGIKIIGSIAIVLIGTFPMVYFITKVFNKPLIALGKKFGMNDIAAAGMVATLANVIPMLKTLKNMDNKGKLINMSFAVSAAFAFGDHLGFTAGVEKDLIFPMIVGKLVAGISAVLLAILVADKVLIAIDKK